MNKIFGIGLSKTGTTSLADALAILGFGVVDFPHDAETLRQLESGDYCLKVLENADGMTDIAPALCYKELDEIYPDSKFILTLRNDREKWLKSMKDHWRFLERWRQYFNVLHKFLYFIHVAVYGIDTNCRRRFVNVYEQHESNVREYFKNRPHDLLIFDVTQGDDWRKLCDFLGKPIPEQQFPHSNSRQLKIRGYQWMEYFDKAFAALTTLVPRGSAIAIVDDYKMSDTTVYSTWECAPMLNEHGNYIGRPIDNRHAIENTKHQVELGASHLVVTADCYWWLEAYGDWAAWLKRSFALVHSDETLMVFDLRS